MIIGWTQWKNNSTQTIWKRRTDSRTTHNRGMSNSELWEMHFSNIFKSLSESTPQNHHKTQVLNNVDSKSPVSDHIPC